MKKTILRAALVSVAALSVGSAAVANHSWGTYHWSKKQDEPLAIPLGDNVDDRWQIYLERAMAGGPRVNPNDPFGPAGDGWNDTNEIESPIVDGATDPKRCRAAAGRIEVCNARYGRTGWLGVAGISISDGHIVSGYTKVNDTYFDTATYNKPEWRMMVMCQEIGHDYGLGHTDETFKNENHGTCMDYTNAPAGGVVSGFNYGASNEYINAHDYQQITSTYTHSHLSTTNFGERKLGAAPAAAADAALEGGNSPADWGRAIAYDGKGRPHIFEKNEGGRKIITHVFWTLEHKAGASHDH